MISVSHITDFLLFWGNQYLLAFIVFFVILKMRDHQLSYNNKVVRFFFNIGFCFCIIILLFVFYGLTLGSYQVDYNYQTIDLTDYDGKKEFILTSDQHLGRFNNNWRSKKSIQMIQKLDSDANVLILGDIVNNNSQHLDQIYKLKNLENNKYFVYGNHDYIVEGELNPFKPFQEKGRVKGLTKALNKSDINIIENDYIILEEDEKQKLILGGVDSVWAQKADYSFLNEINVDDTLILMCHNPDCLLEIAQDPYKQKVDLVLCGHTHGGEMRLPFIGSMSPTGLHIHLPSKYDEGYNEYKGIPIYITSGLGNIGVRMRTFNPAEVVILTIK
jgi:hypothetical protein